MHDLKPPYLLFLGDGTSRTLAKTAGGLAHWRPDWCVGQYRLKPDAVNLGLPNLDPQEAASQGAKALVIGVVNHGGYLDPSWIDALTEAMESGLDLVSGLHQRLTDHPGLRDVATRTGRRLVDVRHHDEPLTVGSGEPRPGRRLLTVGTDCAIGKMFTSLALTRALEKIGVPAVFRATGQTGILIAGTGICVDAVVADFISGAAEQLAPAGVADRWDIIEGQGSLFHPSFAGVTLGLVHGAQAEALILCHHATRRHMIGTKRPLPPVDVCLDAYRDAARLTCPTSRCVAISVNTSEMTETESAVYLRQLEDETGLPCADPGRGGDAKLAQVVQSL
ncbi:MAG: DUF1611 domain-containing protein [Pseudomonadota bacterium]